MTLDVRRATNGRIRRKRSQSALPGRDRTRSLRIKFIHFTGDFDLLSAHCNRSSTLFWGMLKNSLRVENDATTSGTHRICYCLQEDVAERSLGVYKLIAYREQTKCM
jgi:hypothetical protein